jgi:cysteinyl-tRNA synthetase
MGKNMEKVIVEAIESLVSERAIAMSAGNAVRTKEIEDELSRFGVALSDTRHGTTWKVG